MQDQGGADLSEVKLFICRLNNRVVSKEKEELDELKEKLLEEYKLHARLCLFSK